MCCLRFDADVLLANIANAIEKSEKQEKLREFPISFLKTYCKYLDNVMGGYKFFEIDQKDIDNMVHRYEDNYTCKNGNIEIKKAPNLEFFNQQYPEYVADTMECAADICVAELGNPCPV